MPRISTSCLAITSAAPAERTDAGGKFLRSPPGAECWLPSTLNEPIRTSNGPAGSRLSASAAAFWASSAACCCWASSSGETDCPNAGEPVGDGVVGTIGPEGWTISWGSGAWVFPSEGTTVTGVGSAETGVEELGAEQRKLGREDEDQSRDHGDRDECGLPGPDPDPGVELHVPRADRGGAGRS